MRKTQNSMYAALALTLLVDAYCGEIEDQESPHRGQYEVMRKFGRELTTAVPDMAVHYGVDLTPHLPIETIKKMEATVNEKWAGNLTLFELYKHSEKMAHRLILGLIGHGVNADDDTEDAEWLERKGIDLDTLHGEYFEGAHDAGFALGEAFEKKV